MEHGLWRPPSRAYFVENVKLWVYSQKEFRNLISGTLPSTEP